MNNSDPKKKIEILDSSDEIFGKMMEQKDRLNQEPIYVPLTVLAKFDELKIFEIRHEYIDSEDDDTYIPMKIIARSKDHALKIYLKFYENLMRTKNNNFPFNLSHAPNVTIDDVIECNESVIIGQKDFKDVTSSINLKM